MSRENGFHVGTQNGRQTHGRGTRCLCLSRVPIGFPKIAECVLPPPSNKGGSPGFVCCLTISDGFKGLPKGKPQLLWLLELSSLVFEGNPRGKGTLLSVRLAFSACCSRESQRETTNCVGFPSISKDSFSLVGESLCAGR